jgi:hypothetical protein
MLYKLSVYNVLYLCISPHHVVLLHSKRKGDDDNVRHRPSLKGSQLIYSAFSFFFLL